MDEPIDLLPVDLDAPAPYRLPWYPPLPNDPLYQGERHER